MATLGPMARSIQDLELCSRAVFAASERENLSHIACDVLPLPYREVSLPSKLKIGYYVEDGFIPTSPACARAVRETIEALQAQGHDAVPVEIPAPIEALRIFVALTAADGYATLLSHLIPGESRDPSLFIATLGPRLPKWVRALVAWLGPRLTGEWDMAEILRVSSIKPMRKVLQWQSRRDEFAESVRTLLWRDLSLDAVVCPVQAGPAVTHGATTDMSPIALDTIMYNVVDSTVGVIPVTRVDMDIDMLPKDFSDKFAKAGSPTLAKMYYKSVYKADDMHGLPIGVQIVGPARTEERTLEIMKVVDAALDKRRDGPFRQLGLDSKGKSR